MHHGEELEALRREAGLTKRDLARRLGVARTTVREAEEGRELRSSTLQSYVNVLPGLTPPRLLDTGERRVPPSLPAVTKFHEVAQGVSIRRVRMVQAWTDRSVHVTWALEGVRSTNADLKDAAERTAVMRSIFRGTQEATSRVKASPGDLAGKPRVVRDGDTRHEFRFSKQLRRTGFTYVHESVSAIDGALTPCDPMSCMAAGTHVDVRHPVGILEVTVRLPAGVAPVTPLALAWPTPLAIDGAGRFMESLHGRNVELTAGAKGRALRLRVPRPVVGTTVALGWRTTSEPDTPPERARAHAASDRLGLPDALREAREREGLSLRGLAARMSVSPMTVMRAERGQDVMSSVLERCLDALPTLSPWSLLPPAESSRPLSPAEVHEYQVDLHGCEVREEHKEARISRDGHLKLLITTRDLRRSRPSGEDLRILLGLTKAVLLPSRAELHSVEAAREDLQRIRIHRVAGSHPSRPFQLTIPGRLADAGVSFGRRFHHTGVYALTADRARAATGGPGPYEEGTSFGPVLPTRRLLLSVHFPPGFWPEDIRAHAWPLWRLPELECPDVSTAIHPSGLHVECERRRRRATLAVDQPVLGIKYALSWRVPR